MILQTEGSDKFSTHDFESWAIYSEISAEDSHAEMIHSVSLKVRRPHIIILTLYDKIPKRQIKFNRRNIFIRDHYTCQYCHRVFPEKELNLDHVHPRDKGGKTTWDNIVTSCIKCNSKKANKLGHEIGMFPLNEPRQPHWRPMYGLKESNAVTESWKQFIQF